MLELGTENFLLSVASESPKVLEAKRAEAPVCQRQS